MEKIGVWGGFFVGVTFFKKKKGREMKTNTYLQAMLTKISLRTRILLLFITLIVLSTNAVGLSSYLKAKETTIQTIEDRLLRETEFMSYIGKNLKFLYISDDAYFQQQLEISVRSQQGQLEKDGIDAYFYYLQENQVKPFRISEDKDIYFSEQLISKITSVGKGVFQEKINGVNYTVSFIQFPELNGSYLIIVPTNSYMGAITEMAYFTVGVIAISLIVSIIIILLFVQTLTKPLTILRNTMREVREGNLTNTSTIRTSLPEIISLHKSYVAMIEQMRGVLNEIKDTTTELEINGQDLKTSSDDTLSYRRQLIEAINIVKEGADQTASSSESSATSFRQMKQKVEEMMKNIEIVQKSSEDMNSSAQCGEKI